MSNAVLLDIPEVMARTKLGRTFVYGMIQDETLPSIKLGKRRLVLEADLDRFIERLHEEQTV